MIDAEHAWDGKKREKPPTEKLLHSEQEAKVIAMRLGTPPAGYGKWTLPGSQGGGTAIVDSVIYQTVRRTLEKTAWGQSERSNTG